MSRQKAGCIPALTLADGSGPARWATTVEVAWDDAGLQCAFTCRDDDAWATHRERDAPLWQEEVVEVFLAPGPGDPVRYFEIEINPRGALFDAVVDNPDFRRDTMAVDVGWDCAGIAWRIEALGSAEDWWAELFVPWLGLGLTAAPSCLRANFYRIERPRRPGAGPDEFAAWSPTLVSPPDFHQPRRFGLLCLAGAVEALPGLPTLDVPRCDRP